MLYIKILATLFILHAVCSQGMDKSAGPLHNAIFKKDKAAVQEVLNENCDLEIVDGWEQTPLLHAVTANEWDIAKLILAAGANPNASVDGLTALHYVAIEDEPDFAGTLIQENALLTLVNPENGFTPLHYAAQYDSEATVIALCKKGADVTITCTRGMTPLEVALEHNSLGSLASLLTYDSNRSDSLLLKALAKNWTGGVILFLQEGIKLSEQTTNIQERITRLFNGQPSNLRTIILFSSMITFKNALYNFDLENNHLRKLQHALMIAYAQGRLEHTAELERFMKEKSIPALKAYAESLTSAVTRGDAPLCALLLEKINDCTLSYESPDLLNLAAQLKHREIINLLLPQQNLPLVLRNAIANDHRATVEALLNARAPTNEAEAFLSNSLEQNLEHERQQTLISHHHHTANTVLNAGVPTKKEAHLKPLSKREKAYFTALLNRFTVYHEFINNPPQDSYLSGLCRDILLYILDPMVKTQ